MARPRVVVVTGAGAGIGRAISRCFAERGDAVALLARDQERLDDAAREVEEAGGRALAISLDVADAESVDGAASRVEEVLGPIDVWVNNAMVSVFAPFVDIEPAEFRRVTEVTYLGYVYGTRAALRRMRPRDRGVVIQVGSALAYRAIPLQSAYCGAKHAIQGFSESVRTELLHDGSNVHIGCVQLPAVNTPQFDWVLSRLPRRPQPVPPIFQPEVAARAVVQMADHPVRELWVAGSTIGTIVAGRIAPRLTDRYLARNGYTSQQTGEPAREGRPANLWHAVPGPFGAHGRFDDRASARSLLLWLRIHRSAVAAAALAGVGGLVGARRLAARV